MRAWAHDDRGGASIDDGSRRSASTYGGLKIRPINAPEAALENARREGVSDKTKVETGDACALPFPDAAFDVVVSHWVIHNIPASADRTRALDEMMRVLRPNGVLVLADIDHLPDYRKHLEAHGLSNLQVHTGGIESRVIGALSGGTFRPQAIIGSRTAFA